MCFFSEMFNMHESIRKLNLSISKFSKLLCETNYIKNNIFLHMNVRSLNKNIKLMNYLDCYPALQK